MKTTLLFNTLRSGQQWISPFHENIRLDAQTRSEDKNLISEYGKNMFEGRWNWELTDKMIVLFYDGVNLHCGDGNHRIKSARQEYITSIYVDIRYGTKLDAQLYNCESNRYHGKQTTQKDRRNQIRVILEELVKLPDTDSRKAMSDRKIAGIVGVDHKTVGRVRKQLNNPQYFEQQKQKEKEKSFRKKINQFRTLLRESNTHQLAEHLSSLDQEDLVSLSVAIDSLTNTEDNMLEAA